MRPQRRPDLVLYHPDVHVQGKEARRLLDELDHPANNPAAARMMREALRNHRPA